MSDQWLCLIDGQKIGPVKFARLQQLAEAGRLKAEDRVRLIQDEQWLIAGNIPTLIPAPAVTVDQPEAAETPPPAKRRLPVAQAISEPVGIPRGKAVAPSAPVGKAVPPPPAGGLPFTIGDPSASPGHAAGSLLHGRKKKADPLPLVIGGAAVVGVLAIVLVLVLNGAIDLSGNATAAVSADVEKKSELPPATEAFSDEEANPDAEEAPKASVKSGPAPGKHPLLKTVKQYLDITKRYRVSNTLPVQVAVTGLWLSASEQGEPYVAAEGASEKPVARFLVVKLKIDNAPGAAPLDYQGWGDEAVLFDDANQAIQPLPPGSSPERIAKQRIEPGSSLVDTLVFQLPGIDFERLRLALPHETVGIKDAKSYGLELPRHALGRGLETKLAGGEPVVNPRVSADGGPGEIIDTNAPPIVKPAAAKPLGDELGLDKLEARARELDKMEREKEKK